MEEPKLPPTPADWFSTLGPRMVTQDEAKAYASECIRLAVEEERERIARFIEHEYERQWARPWREHLVATIRGDSEPR